MRTFILLIMAALAGMTCRAQERKPEGGVRILTAGQHITPYRIGVPFSKTVHILFPSEVRYVDLGSTDIIAGKADGVENVVRVKAAVRDFPGETNFSVITGDGSFHMNLNEACTAVSYELPIITVIFNNSVLGMVRQWQTTFYEKRYSQTDPHRRTDFVKLAEGFGLKGYRCTNLPEFQAAFADALKQKGPTWIECIIDKDEKVLPMIPGGGDINDIIME